MELRASHFDELTRKYGIRRIRTAPEHPQANGQVERLHRFMRGSIAAMSNGHQGQWHRLLPVAAFAYRSSRVAGLRHSPFELMYGREPMPPGELMAVQSGREAVAEDESTATLRHRLSAAFASARELDDERRERQVEGQR